MKKIILFTLVITLCACTSKQAEAFQYLEKSRNAMALRRYDVARDTILAMRHRFPEAIEARRQGILLMDSIELQAAKDSLCAMRTVPEGLSPEEERTHNEEYKRLEMKVRFFERKLSEDLKK